MKLRDLDGRVTITVEECARLLGIGRSSAYEAIRRGDLPSLRLSRRIVIPTRALLRLLENGNAPPDEGGAPTERTTSHGESTR